MNPDLEGVTTLGVYLEERRIGILNRLAGDRHLFAFDMPPNPDDKYNARGYSNIASVLWAETGPTGTYPDGRTPVPSPAYDSSRRSPTLPVTAWRYLSEAAAV